MWAVMIRAPGDVDQLQYEQVPDPDPGPDHVLIRVAACGVCYRDLLDREGRYLFMTRPIITGHEFSGEIVGLGPGVATFQVGDRVAVTHKPPCEQCSACASGDELYCMNATESFGHSVHGGYAELCVAHISSLVRVPPGVDLTGASFLHCTAAVALRALRTRARLRAGETVVITGAAGGVGIHAVQIAKILGARVVAVTSDRSKTDVLRERGADEVVVYQRGRSFHADVLRCSGGADVALELVGAPTFGSSLRSLKPGGRLVVVGNITTEQMGINPAHLITREISVVGSLSATRADLADVLEWTRVGRLTPVIADRLALAHAREAQTRLATTGVVGRIVLVPGDTDPHALR
jgi:acryloyl-coenzyme A reductase